jgi:hypothetical protein
MRRLVSLLVGLTLAVPLWAQTPAPPAASAPAVYVVVGAASPVRALTQREALALYTGRSRNLPSGEVAQPLDHGRDSAERERFYLLLTGMDLARINSYWSRLQYTGQVQPPRELPAAAAVVAQLKREPLALGYLSTEPNDPQLRVVLVLREAASR